MLELKQITKTYVTAGETVHALKGVDLSFREHEFVAILGPSGCGKTTLLNIVGGLDHYTSGDLVINEKSTKDFTERDWDSYRNHSIGFVFQSYNLIPHQTVLQNVELALTLSGVSKAERRARAKAALERVGLADQLKKRPTEMSGGQMQRVAIARAIVNDPDIVLADEPTGALDTETSLQVMDILKEISKDRLVIMVTHNPDLADRYATRVINILDGQITGDSMPPTAAEIAASRTLIQAKRDEFEAADRQTQRALKKAEKKPSMSIFTSFGLSLKNLFTKKGRTTLVSFAGSIGIIGIALIYAVSQGTTNYIDSVQENTLASYPLTIEAQTIDTSSLLTTFMGKAQSTVEHEDDAVYQKAMLYELMNSLNSLEAQENDLASFRDYLTRELADSESTLAQALSGVQYSYDLNMLVYTKGIDGKIVVSDTQALMTELISEYMGFDINSYSSSMGSFSSYSMMGSYTLWEEILADKEGGLISPLMDKQYDLINGRWPEAYNEIVLFVDEHNELDDLTLYALGLKTKDEMDALMKAAMSKEQIVYERRNWSYDKLLGLDLRTVLNADCFVKDSVTGLYTDLRDTDAGLRYLYDNGLTLRIVGIARPNPDSASHMISGALGYTTALTEYLINAGQTSEAVKAQKETPDIDIFTGLRFRPEEKASDEEKSKDFLAYVDELDEAGKASVYLTILCTPSDELVEQTVTAQLAQMTREEMEKTLSAALKMQMGLDDETIAAYLANMSDESLYEIFYDMAAEQFTNQYAAAMMQNVKGMTPAMLASSLTMALEQMTDAERAGFYDDIVKFSDSDYESNLLKLGCLDLAEPSSVNLFASTFENKDIIVDAIKAYNETVGELHELHYTDYVGILMSSVKTIINAISYVLIAFVSVSLVVSSIMIGVITLISVQERTKEIGILRAIGASKRNVSNLFNAETVIIGFTSGLLGVCITWLLTLPINAILHSLTKIQSLNAELPLPVAAALVGISVLLTLIAGIIPSSSAAKKDPVVALRTE